MSQNTNYLFYLIPLIDNWRTGAQTDRLGVNSIRVAGKVSVVGWGFRLPLTEVGNELLVLVSVGAAINCVQRSNISQGTAPAAAAARVADEGWG
jgi:hypothetical protein